MQQKGNESRLATKEEIPELTAPGKTTYFGNRFCPFARRARWVAAEVGFPLDGNYIHIQLGDGKPEWYQQMVNPAGTVPCLYVDGRPVFESSIVAQYMDDVSGSPLTPKDAWQRATIRFLADRFDSKITGSLYGLLMETDPAKADDCKKKLREALEDYDALYRRNAFDVNGPYIRGDQLSLVEVTALSMIDWHARSLLHYRKFDLFKDCKIPGLEKAYDAAKQRAAFQTTSVTDEGLVQMYRPYADGSKRKAMGGAPKSAGFLPKNSFALLGLGALVGAGAVYAFKRS